jgi:hypothetical protein
MSEESLIKQALEANAAARPVHPGNTVSITPAQAMAWCVYLAVEAVHRGWGTSPEVDRYIRAARSAGIAQHEVDAAIAAAEQAAQERVNTGR